MTDERDSVVEELAADLQNHLELAWWRFVLGKDPAPEYWPASVRLVVDVFSDMPGSPLRLAAGREYDVCSNQHGAVLTRDHKLGLKPAEYEVLTWTDRKASAERYRFTTDTSSQGKASA